MNELCCLRRGERYEACNDAQMDSFMLVGLLFVILGLLCAGTGFNHRAPLLSDRKKYSSHEEVGAVFILTFLVIHGILLSHSGGGCVRYRIYELSARAVACHVFVRNPSPKHLERRRVMMDMTVREERQHSKLCAHNGLMLSQRRACGEDNGHPHHLL